MLLAVLRRVHREMLALRIGGVDREPQVGESEFSDLVPNAVLLQRELDAMRRVVVENARRLVSRARQVPHEVGFAELPIAARALKIVRIELLGDLRIFLVEALLGFFGDLRFVDQQPADEVRRRAPSVVAITASKGHDRRALVFARELDDEAVALEHSFAGELELA